MSEAERIQLQNAQGRRYRLEKALRWSALITGGGLALLGLSRRSRSGVASAAAGGLLSYAGAEWMDQGAVTDGNLVSARKPDDIPAFNRAMIELFSAGAQKKCPAA
jgi:putative intracellular protease/amidase